VGGRGREQGHDQRQARSVAGHSLPLFILSMRPIDRILRPAESQFNGEHDGQQELPSGQVGGTQNQQVSGVRECGGVGHKGWKAAANLSVFSTMVEAPSLLRVQSGAQSCPMRCSPLRHSNLGSGLKR
jgi:hypothetical protein